jgi:arylsulfatase
MRGKARQIHVMAVVAAGWLIAVGPGGAQEIVQEAPYLEPHLVHADQRGEARTKLQSLASRFGRPPNIVSLLVDDMGWGDPGVYGGGEAVGAATPNIDRLAREGLRLTSAYSQPTCTPTRATLLTGRLPMRHGLLRPPQIGEPGGLEGEITLASLLGEVGYRTAAVGKWHLGEAPDHQPQSNGFDEYYGFLGSLKNYTEWRDPRINPTLANDPRVTRAISSNPRFIRSMVRAEAGKPLEKLYELDVEAVANADLDCMRYSVDFIRRMAEQSSPWFLYHCFGKVHYDNYPGEGFRGASAAKGVYQDAVDQTSFLLAGDGESNREAVFYYMGDTFSAMRVGPLKFHRYVAEAAPNEGVDGFINGATLHRTAGIYAFNLCLDPGERRPYGVRTAILLDRMVKIQSRHLATFERYPPKVVIAAGE